MKLADREEKVAAKGVKTSYMRQNLKHALYQDCLANQQVHLCKFRSIRSFKQTLKTVEVKKTALSSYDDKRYLLDDGYASLAFGHRSIPYLRSAYETTSGPPSPLVVEPPCLTDLPEYELALDAKEAVIVECE